LSSFEEFLLKILCAFSPPYSLQLKDSLKPNSPAATQRIEANKHQSLCNNSFEFHLSGTQGYSQDSHTHTRTNSVYMFAQTRMHNFWFSV